MAIAHMEKVIIVTHRSQASELLEALQQEGICHILNAEEAMVSKDSPDLAATAERPRDVENLLNRLTRSIEFLKAYAKPQKGLASMLASKICSTASQEASNSSKRTQNHKKVLPPCSPRVPLLMLKHITVSFPTASFEILSTKPSRPTRQ
jgi:vacuolar-type H+-ATPase subunit I/STV1